MPDLSTAEDVREILADVLGALGRMIGARAIDDPMGIATGRAEARLFCPTMCAG